MIQLIVGFSKPRKLKVGSELIKLWINKPYSHVYMRYIDSQGRDLVFHAAHGTVHPILFENFNKENETLKQFELELSVDEYELFKNIYYEKCGILYSKKGIICIPIHDIAWKMGFYLKTEDDPGYICSELAGYALTTLKGIKFKKPFNILRPDDIDQRLQLLSDINI